MIALAPGERKTWKSTVDPDWMRTGCRGCIDAILWAFRDYRDADVKEQEMMRSQRIKDDSSIKTEEDGLEHQVQRLEEVLAEVINGLLGETDMAIQERLFRHLISPRSFETRLLPKMRNMARRSTGWDDFKDSFKDTCLAMGLKKMQSMEEDDDTAIEILSTHFTPFIDHLLE